MESSAELWQLSRGPSSGRGDAALFDAYRATIELLVERSPLSRAEVGFTLEDMLLSDRAILWQLMGYPAQSEGYERSLGGLMDDVQSRMESEPAFRRNVRLGLAAHLQRLRATRLPVR